MLDEERAKLLHTEWSRRIENCVQMERIFINHKAHNAPIYILNELAIRVQIAFRLIFRLEKELFGWHAVETKLPN